MLVILLPLVLASLTPCQNIELLRQHAEIKTCNFQNNQCRAAQDLFLQAVKTCLAESKVLKSSQSFSDFFEGLFNGIQKDPSSPSQCIQSFSALRSSLLSFIENLEKFGFTPLIQSLFSFDEVVTRATSTYALCKFSDLYSVLHPGSVWNGLSSVFSHWLMEKDEVRETWKNLFQALDSENYISAGIYTGKLMTLLTSYSI